MSRWRVERPSSPAAAAATSIEACTPPLMKVTWLIVHSMMSWPARVAMAR